jgi:hypothetical protein
VQDCDEVRIGRRTVQHGDGAGADFVPAKAGQLFRKGDVRPEVVLFTGVVAQ